MLKDTGFNATNNLPQPPRVNLFINKHARIMSSGLFTKDGVLLGAFEYGAYSGIARLIMVAFVSDVVIRFVLAHRIGIFLVADLSSKAAFRIFSANFMHKSNKRWAARFQVVVLFAVAFFVTRGLDIIASTYSSTMQASRSQRIVFVRTADTSPGARPAVRSASILRPYNRSDVYHALHSIVKGAEGAIDVGQPVWPRTIGSLSDAEVAALVLAQDGSMCSATDLGPAPTALSPGSANATSARLGLIEALRTRSMSLFGEDVELINIQIDRISPSNGVSRWLVFPAPISYLTGQDGQQPVTRQAHRQFGVLSSRLSELIAYDMECGWTPEQVDTWLKDKQRIPRNVSSLNPQNASTLWYADVMQANMSVDDDTQGWTAAMIMDATKEAHNSGELELLSFGSTIRGWAYYYGMSVVPLSNLIRQRDADAGRVFSYTTLADAHPSRPASQTGCATVDAPYQVYAPNDNNPVVDDENADVQRWISRGPAKSLGTSQEHPIRRCSVDFGPHPTNRTARIMHYYHDPSNRGAQICRTRIRSFPSNIGDDLKTSRDGFVDLLAATQFSAMAGNQHTQVRCLSQNGAGPLGPVSLPFASSRNGRWGVIVDNTLQAFNQSTLNDPAGAQLWFLDVSEVPWLELGAVLAAAVYLLTMSGWDDLAEVVAIVMYSFSYRPVPPALPVARPPTDASNATLGDPQIARDKHEPADLQHGVCGINLLQPIAFAAVEYDGPRACTLQDGSRAVDVRLVPSAWDVQPGDNLSMYPWSGAGRDSAETVVQVNAQIGQLVEKAKLSKKMPHPV